MAKAETDLAAELMDACGRLEERYGKRKLLKHADFIEALVFQILELGVKEAAARQTLERLRTEYVDWNDMRVATVREIEDILGHRYYRCREKAEDVKHLLTDIYTAFRRMEIQDLLNAEGIATLRALPDYTNIRRDMVDRALLLVLDLKVFPCDENQFKLLKYLGGVPKHLAYQVGTKKIEESLDPEQMLRLSRVLREHVHVCSMAGEEEPQPIDFAPSSKKDKEKADTKSVKKGTGSVKKDTAQIKRDEAKAAFLAKRHAEAESEPDLDDDDEDAEEPDEYKPATARHQAKVTDKTTRKVNKPEAKVVKAEKPEKSEKTAQPEKKPASGKVVKSEAKPAAKPPTKPIAKSATKPATKPVAKPATKPVSKPDPKATKPEVKASKPETASKKKK